MPNIIKVIITFEFLEDAKNPLEELKKQLLSEGIPVDIFAEKLKVVRGKFEQVRISSLQQYHFTWVSNN